MAISSRDFFLAAVLSLALLAGARGAAAQPGLAPSAST